MIIVTGTLTGSEATIAELLELSVAHVVRSRQEPGCVSHSVARDVENPFRLTFLEHWTGTDALRTHFAVSAAGEFARRATALTVEPPTLEVYDASQISLR
jgi:quinol monooxygenase YgiN